MTVNLKRFHTAQEKRAAGYEQALRELTSGQKTDHWIWYIFPQLFELGFSPTAKQYGIVDLDEACAYLRDPVLFERYHALVMLVEQQLASIPLRTLMGSEVDAQKLMSSLTLFRAAAAHLYSQQPNHEFESLETSCNTIFSMVKEAGYQPCDKTLKHIKKHTIVTVPIVIMPEPPVSPRLPRDFMPGFFGSSISTGQSDSIPAKPLDVFKPDAASDESKITPTLKHDITASEIAEPIQPNPTILPVLDDYIRERRHEWGFHYNFLGIMSVLYFIKDQILGTDHFNSKNREIKISAAQKLTHLINEPTTCNERFSKAEEEALQEGRLGKIVDSHGGLKQLLQESNVKPSKDNVSHPGNMSF